MDTTVKVVCYKHKILSDGTHPLMVQATKDRKVKRISLGLRVRPEHWDFKKECPKKHCPDKELIEVYIAKTEANYRHQLLEFKVMDKDFTLETLFESIENKKKPDTVQTMFENKIALLLGENSLNNADNYKYTMRGLIKFNGHLNIPFSDVTVYFLKRYVSWMKGQGMQSVTIKNHVIRLRTIYNEAIENKCAKRDDYPFNAFKVSKLYKWEGSPQASLSLDEMQKIIDYRDEVAKRPIAKQNNNEKKDWQELALDVFIFSYYSGGMNLTDICRLKYKNIYYDATEAEKIKFEFNLPSYIADNMQDDDINEVPLDVLYDLADGKIESKIRANMISKIRQKTGKVIPLPLMPNARMILERFNTDDYIFDILDSSKHKTEIQIMGRINRVGSKINQALKTVAKETHIDKNITMYYARRSQARILHEQGIAYEIIRQIMGHENIETTKRYILKIQSHQEVRDAMKTLTPKK